MTLSRRDTLKGLLSLTTAGITNKVSKSFAKEKKITSDKSASLKKNVQNKNSNSTEPIVSIEDPKNNYPNTKPTEEMYRQEFLKTFGDPKERGYAFHCVNCQGNCAWEVWIKDGKVTRENQSRSYPQISPEIPDPNPRGCNKGGGHSQTMYSEERLLYPLKRVGLRGEGKWKRISWSEAIEEISHNIYETLINKGPAGNYIHMGAGVLTESRATSVKRLGTLLGAVRPYIASYVGDMFPGVTTVFGEGNIGCTYDFIYTTQVAIFWGCNPNTSRIPDAHYLWEAKYNGSKIIVITPEFNSTAIHADLWVPINPGYDGQMALSILYEMLNQKTYKESFLKEFTDLPLLIHEESGKLLRLSEVVTHDPLFDEKTYKILTQKYENKVAHEEEVFLVWNQKNQKFSPLPGCEGSPIDSLRLKDLSWEIDPALEGHWKIRLKNGTSISVTTVFETFKNEIKKYSPETTHPLTGVHPTIVQELARDISRSKNVLITLGFSIGKHFNGMLSQRAIAALAAFSGHLGPLGGLNTENEWNISGLEGLSGFEGRYQHRFASGFVSEFILGDGFKDFNTHFSNEDLEHSTGLRKESYQEKIKSLLKPSEGDKGFQKGKPYWESVETFLLFADARFRRNKGSYKESFLKKAKFIAYGDIRMSDFALYADILLPCKSHYEVWDLRTNPGYHRFANIAQPPRNLKNVGETKSEWEISSLISLQIQKIALQKFKASGEKKYIHIPDPTHTRDGFRKLDEIYNEFTIHGKINTDQDAVHYCLEHVEQFKPNTVKTIYQQGGFLTLNEKAGKSSPLYAHQPYNSFENQLYLKHRFETISGRLTFYIDHPLWLEQKAHIITARKPIRPERFPYLLMTPHARWSIHSTYKTSPLLLRLQRGKPSVMIHPKIAQKNGIKDGDSIRLYNDLSEIFVMAKISTTTPHHSLILEHGWEPFFYKKRKGHNELEASLINLLELSDQWGHLKFGVHWDGNQHAYETMVNIEKV